MRYIQYDPKFGSPYAFNSNLISLLNSNLGLGFQDRLIDPVNITGSNSKGYITPGKLSHTTHHPHKNRHLHPGCINIVIKPSSVPIANELDHVPEKSPQILMG